MFARAGDSAKQQGNKKSLLFRFTELLHMHFSIDPNRVVMRFSFDAGKVQPSFAARALFW